MTQPSSTTAAISAATPYLIVRGASVALEFYQAAFLATIGSKMVGEDGKVAHAELRLGDALVYLADEFPDTERIVGPASLDGTSVIIALEVSDVVAAFERATGAGATPVRFPDLPGTGVQSAKVVDPFGHVWLITRVVE